MNVFEAERKAPPFVAWSVERKFSHHA